jgi:hypothetical protein
MKNGPPKRMNGRKFVLIFFLSAIVIAALAAWSGWLGLRILPH